VHPVWQLGAFRVEGPDEDSFTLGVEALQSLGGQLQADGARALRRLHLVGSFSPEVDWAFGEALGIPNLEVRRHPASAPGLWGALAAAAHDEGSTGREAVVAADTTTAGPEDSGDVRIPSEAGSVAFLLGQEPGLAVLRHGFRGHAPGRPPSLKASVAGWLNALGMLPGARAGEAVLAVDDERARWQTAWEEQAPGITVTLAEPGAVSGRVARTLPAAKMLWELGRRLRTRGVGLVAEAVRGRSGFACFRLDGPVRWVGSWGMLEPGMAALNERRLERPSILNTVSQGAYVPHARYLENLGSRWRLIGERCSTCRALTFPSAGRCRSCGRSDGLRAEGQGRTGLEVEAVTTIGPGAQPTEFDALVEAAGAYEVAVVALGSRARATVQVTDARPGEVHVADRVRLVLRRLYPIEGEWRYGLKAVPERSRAPAPGPSKGSSSSGARGRRTSSAVPTARRATPRGPDGRAAAHRRAER
jgi:uncharacterized OB-fold protein